MSEPILIVIEGEPVAKGRPRLGRMANGRPVAFTPAHTRKYEDRLRNRAGDAMQGKNPLDAPVRVDIVAYLPIPASWSQKRQKMALAGLIVPQARPDADNYLKIALDGLNKIVFRDDSLAVDVTARKRYSLKPRLEIRVAPLELAPGLAETFAQLPLFQGEAA